MESRGRGLFSLPRELRDDIYRLVLVVPHPLYLFADGPRVGIFAPERPQKWLALLSTNREIRNEAAETLYGAHQFVLVDPSPRQATLLELFLLSIRSVDLRHICINFPAIDKKGSGGDGEGSEEAASSMLREEDLRGLKLLQDMCGGLRTLETRVDNRNSRGLVVPRGQGESVSLEDVEKALAEVEERLKGIVSLEKVVVKLYHGSLKPEVEKLMRSFGWVVV